MNVCVKSDLKITSPQIDHILIDSNSIGDSDSTWRILGMFYLRLLVRFGFEEKLKRNYWFDDECQRVTNEKSDAYSLMQQKYTRRRREEYKERRRRL
ncbi:unnamed protein product, partial [Brenthis ino]